MQQQFPIVISKKMVGTLGASAIQYVLAYQKNANIENNLLLEFKCPAL
jgi:hypothetical protein